eukprot:GILJ01010431.1.p1 GENE.GILJ01010431.1~~GILJ01010431.1.p1  ORF type:complete len:168 (+),score=32.94 GILJ01010431.1:29-532(+)
MMDEQDVINQSTADGQEVVDHSSAHLSTDVLSPEDNPDYDVAQWMKEQMAKEIARLKTQGATVIPMTVKNTGVVKGGGKKAPLINRVEVDTGFDFDKVKQIMLSDPIPSPKEGFSYVNVLLFTDKPVPLILPYLFDSRKNRNSLSEWVFINNKLIQSRHRVNNFSTV